MKGVYLSGPITGLYYGPARFGWRADFAKLLEPGITVLSPMRHEGHLSEMKSDIQPDNLPSNLFSHPKMIVEKDFLDIDVSTIVVANLLGAKAPSQGTLIELGYARARGKTIVTIAESGDKVHNTPFIPVISAVITPNLEEAAAIVNSLLSEGI